MGETRRGRNSHTNSSTEHHMSWRWVGSGVGTYSR